LELEVGRTSGGGCRLRPGTSRRRRSLAFGLACYQKSWLAEPLIELLAPQTEDRRIGRGPGPALHHEICCSASGKTDLDRADRPCTRPNVPL